MYWSEWFVGVTCIRAVCCSDELLWLIEYSLNTWVNIWCLQTAFRSFSSSSIRTSARTSRQRTRMHRHYRISLYLVTSTTTTLYQRSYSTSSPVSTWMGDVSGFDSRRRHFISVCNQPSRSTQPFILSRSINWVVSCNRMFASSHGRRHLVNAYGVKAWCGWLGRWCVL